MRGVRSQANERATVDAERAYPDHPVLAVGAVVVRNGQVLLVLRGREPGRGLWSLPGGVVHTSEALRAAVARELREECGIEVAVAETAEVVERMIPDTEGRLQYHYVILDYLATWVRGELVASDEVEDARWVDPDDLYQYQMTRGTADVIRRLLARFACAAADRQCGEVQDLGG